MIKVYQVGINNNKIHNSLSRRHDDRFDLYRKGHAINTDIENTFVGKEPNIIGSTLVSHSIYNYDSERETTIVLRFPQGRLTLFPGDFVIVDNKDLWIGTIKSLARYWLKFNDSVITIGLRTYKMEDTEL